MHPYQYMFWRRVINNAVDQAAEIRREEELNAALATRTAKEIAEERAAHREWQFLVEAEYEEDEARRVQLLCKAGVFTPTSLDEFDF